MAGVTEIAQCPDLLDAHRVLAILEGAGIEARLDEDLGATWAGVGVIYARVLVADEDAAAAVSALRDAGGRPDDERPAPKELPAALGGRSGSIRVRVGTVVVGVVLLAIVVALVRAYAGG